MEKNKNLRDVFELYKEYTGFKGDYDNNTFSTKLRSVIDKYNLKPFQKLHEDDMKELEKRIKNNRPLSTEYYYSQITE